MPITGNSRQAITDLVALLRANRKPAIVLSTDLVGLTAASQATATLGDDHLYVIAGYTSDDALASAVNGGEYAAVAIFSTERLIAKAVRAAAAAARGDRLPERVELQIPVLDSPENSAAPKMYRAYKKMENEEEELEPVPAQKKQEGHG